MDKYIYVYIYMCVCVCVYVCVRMPSHDRLPQKEPTGIEINRNEDTLVRIYNKVEGSSKMLKDLINDVSTLSDMLNLHLVSIKELENQLG